MSSIEETKPVVTESATNTEATSVTETNTKPATTATPSVANIFAGLTAAAPAASNVAKEEEAEGDDNEVRISKLKAKRLLLFVGW